MIGTSNNVFAEHAWRYRDYLIEAFNNDKPFDLFVREQIAGDLMEASTPQEKANNITATGFLMLGDVEIVEPDKPKMETDHIDTHIYCAAAKRRRTTASVESIAWIELCHSLLSSNHFVFRL